MGKARSKGTTGRLGQIGDCGARGSQSPLFAFQSCLLPLRSSMLRYSCACHPCDHHQLDASEKCHALRQYALLRHDGVQRPRLCCISWLICIGGCWDVRPKVWASTPPKLTTAQENSKAWRGEEEHLVCSHD